MNESTSGFYCLMDGDLLYAPNFVSAPTFELNVANAADRLLEIDGWKYFDTLEAAKLYNGII